MTDQTPSGDHAVFTFLEGIALALSFGAVDSVLSGKPWTVSAGCAVASVLFFLAGIKWPRIRGSLSGSAVQSVEWLASHGWLIFAAVGLYVAITHPQCRSYGLGFAAGCLTAGCVTYVRAIRRDLDRYVMPRRLTSQQSRRLRSYLARQDKRSIAVNAIPGDPEARAYADQIVRAFRDGGWDAQFSTAPPPHNLGDGVHMNEIGDLKLLPKPDPRQVIQLALFAARIRLDTSGGIAGAGAFKVEIVVGRRPLAIYPWQPTLTTRFGSFIARMGRRR